MKKPTKYTRGAGEKFSCVSFNNLENSFASFCCGLEFQLPHTTTLTFVRCGACGTQSHGASQGAAYSTKSSKKLKKCGPSIEEVCR